MSSFPQIHYSAAASSHSLSRCTTQHPPPVSCLGVSCLTFHTPSTTCCIPELRREGRNTCCAPQGNSSALVTRLIQQPLYTRLQQRVQEKREGEEKTGTKAIYSRLRLQLKLLPSPLAHSHPYYAAKMLPHSLLLTTPRLLDGSKIPLHDQNHMHNTEKKSHFPSTLPLPYCQAEGGGKWGMGGFVAKRKPASPTTPAHVKTGDPRGM